MTRHDAPIRIWDRISIQQIGTETLVYDERRHRAFCLNESSAVIWQLADGKRSVPEICRAASLQLRTQVSYELVLLALEELQKDGLVQVGPITETRLALSRRATLQKLGAGGILLLPAVAAIVAPTAAQAYNGCFDCSASQATGARKQRAAKSPAQ